MDKNLLIVLANGLAVALEMTYDPVELRELWSTELDALRQAEQALTSQGIAVPSAVVNVLKLASEDGQLPDA